VPGYRQFNQEELQNDAPLTSVLAPIILEEITVGRNDDCPCGSEHKFKKCHLRTLERIQPRIALRR
jgi:uncharacterized protein YecA (UPF0149 family)